MRRFLNHLGNRLSGLLLRCSDGCRRFCRIDRCNRILNRECNHSAATIQHRGILVTPRGEVFVNSFFQNACAFGRAFFLLLSSSGAVFGGGFFRRLAGGRFSLERASIRACHRARASHKSGSFPENAPAGISLLIPWGGVLGRRRSLFC